MDIVKAARLVPRKAEAAHPLEAGNADLLAAAATCLKPPPPPRSIEEARERRQEFVDYERKKKEDKALMRAIIDTMVGRERAQRLAEAEEESAVGELIFDGLKAFATRVASAVVRVAGMVLRIGLRILVSVVSSIISVVGQTIAFLMANPLVALGVGLVALGFYGWYKFKHKDDDIKDAPGERAPLTAAEIAANEPTLVPKVAKPALSVVPRENTPQGIQAAKPVVPYKDNLSGPPVGPSSQGSPAIPKAAAGNLSAAVTFFQSKGWTKEQAAGIAANLHCESALKPDAKGDYVGGNATAYGIAQWHKDRRAKFEQVFGKSIVGTTVEEQMAFVDWELRHTEGGAGKKLAATTTAQEAGAAVSIYYERPGDKMGEATKRGALAEKLAKADSTQLAQSTSVPQSASERQTAAQQATVAKAPPAKPQQQQQTQVAQSQVPPVGAPTTGADTPAFVKGSKKEPLIRMAA